MDTKPMETDILPVNIIGIFLEKDNITLTKGQITLVIWECESTRQFASVKTILQRVSCVLLIDTIIKVHKIDGYVMSFSNNLIGKM